MPKQSSEKPNEQKTRKAFRYRLYPTKQQEQTLLFVLRRVEKTFAAFFRRVANGEKPGYPRFKSTSRYKSFTYPQSGFALAGWPGSAKERYARLTLAKLGDFKVRLHRPMVGQVKTCTIMRDVDQWYVTFSCEVEEEPLPPCEEAVGIDLGLLHFATLSTGETIENPRPYRRGLKRIKRLSHIKDNRTKGSQRRKRAALALAKAHRRVRHQRQDFQHKAARSLVNRFGTLVFEDLAILNMSAAPDPKPDPEQDGAYLPNGASAKAGLNQSILDAGWGQFQQFCVAKAESAGRQVVLVDPYNTSQQCSGCQKLVPKDMDVRTHVCPHCGLVLDRDHNAALNILLAWKRPTTLRSRRSPVLSTGVLHG